MRRFFASAAALALLAGLVIPAVSGAGSANKGPGRFANSKVTIGIGFRSGTGAPFFQGNVQSGRKSCTTNRPVTVFFQRNRGKNTQFGRTRTDSSANWHIDMHATMKTGGYFARVGPNSKCKKDLSSALGVGENGPGGLGRVARWLAG